VSAAPEPQHLLPFLADPTFDPLAESFTEVDAVPERAPSPPRGAPATIVRDEPHVVEVEATLAAPGLVVLADSFYPGWQATVDGRAAAIVPVNYLYRGVAAAAGTHRVRFEYRPGSVRYGAAISLVGLVVAAGLAVAAGQARRV
jgi:membrane protein YfhO